MGDARRLTFLEREEFKAAARRDDNNAGVKTGSDARDWLVAQAAKGAG